MTQCQQDNAPWHTAEMVRNGLRNMTVFKVSSCPPISSDLKQVRPMETPTRNLQRLKDSLLMSWC